MKKCEHKSTQTMIGPYIVQVMCMQCDVSAEGVRYGKQAGSVMELPAWAHRAYLSCVLRMKEDIL